VERGLQIVVPGYGGARAFTRRLLCEKGQKGRVKLVGKNSAGPPHSLKKHQ